MVACHPCRLFLVEVITVELAEILKTNLGETVSVLRGTIFLKKDDVLEDGNEELLSEDLHRNLFFVILVFVVNTSRSLSQSTCSAGMLNGEE